jgi:hypothetical protein
MEKTQANEIARKQLTQDLIDLCNESKQWLAKSVEAARVLQDMLDGVKCLQKDIDETCQLLAAIK